MYVDGRVWCMLMGGCVFSHCITVFPTLDREAFQVLTLNILVNGVKMGVRSKLEVMCVCVCHLGKRTRRIVYIHVE